MSSKYDGAFNYHMEIVNQHGKMSEKFFPFLLACRVSMLFFCEEILEIHVRFQQGITGTVTFRSSSQDHREPGSCARKCRISLSAHFATLR